MDAPRALALALLLLATVVVPVAVPAASADHPDHDCWGLDGAASCFVKDGPGGADAFARRVCDEVTGQACTSP